MFYEPSLNNHGLPHAPFKSLVVPRPIAWITTIDEHSRVNLAPFSQFNILGWDPPRVMFSASKQITGLKKDTVRNIEETSEFVLNLATWALRDAVAASANITDPTVDELAATGLTPVPSRLVKPPRIKESPVHMECRFEHTVALPCDTPGNIQSVVIGRVIGVHIDDAYITDEGRVDILKIRPLARMGYLDYTSVTDVFQLHGADEFTLRHMSGGRVPSKAET